MFGHEHIASNISDCGNYFAHIYNSSGFKVIYIFTSNGNQAGSFDTNLADPHYIALRNDGKRFVIVDKGGSHEIQSIPNWWLKMHNLKNPLPLRLKMQDYLRSKLVCLDLRKSPTSLLKPS